MTITDSEYAFVPVGAMYDTISVYDADSVSMQTLTETPGDGEYYVRLTKRETTEDGDDESAVDEILTPVVKFKTPVVVSATVDDHGRRLAQLTDPSGGSVSVVPPEDSEGDAE